MRRSRPEERPGARRNHHHQEERPEVHHNRRHPGDNRRREVRIHQQPECCSSGHSSYFHLLMIARLRAGFEHRTSRIESQAARRSAQARTGRAAGRVQGMDQHAPRIVRESAQKYTSKIAPGFVRVRAPSWRDRVPGGRLRIALGRPSGAGAVLASVRCVPASVIPFARSVWASASSASLGSSSSADDAPPRGSSTCRAPRAAPPVAFTACSTAILARRYA